MKKQIRALITRNNEVKYEPKSNGMLTPIANPEQKLRNKLAFEAKKRKERTHFVLNPDVEPPKVFLHERKY
jgi:hypothetical protein